MGKYSSSDITKLLGKTMPNKRMNLRFHSALSTLGGYPLKASISYSDEFFNPIELAFFYKGRWYGCTSRYALWFWEKNDGWFREVLFSCTQSRTW